MPTIDEQLAEVTRRDIARRQRREQRELEERLRDAGMPGAATPLPHLETGSGGGVG